MGGSVERGHLPLDRAEPDLGHVLGKDIGLSSDSLSLQHVAGCGGRSRQSGRTDVLQFQRTARPCGAQSMLFIGHQLFSSFGSKTAPCARLAADCGNWRGPRPARRQNGICARPVAFPGEASRGVTTRRLNHFLPSSSIFDGRLCRAGALPSRQGEARSRPRARQRYRSIFR